MLWNSHYKEWNQKLKPAQKWKSNCIWMLLVFSKAVQMWKKLAMNIQSNYITNLSAATVKIFPCLLSIALPFMSFTNHIKTTKPGVQEQEFTNTIIKKSQDRISLVFLTMGFLLRKPVSFTKHPAWSRNTTACFVASTKVINIWKHSTDHK